MAATLYLLRHGRIVGHDIRRYLGRTDTPLDEVGRKQAALWSERLGPGRFGRVLCSPLSRSLDTALLVAGDDPAPEILPELAEIDLGDWEGQAMAEVRRDVPDLYAARGRNLAGFRPPGGESFGDLQARVLPVLQALADEDGDMLWAGHAGVNRVVLCHVLGMPLDHLFRLGQDHGCLNVIRLGPRPVVLGLNLPPGPATIP